MIHSIDPAACTGCGTCTKTCPLDVFRLEPAQEALSPCMAACPAGVDIRGNHYLIQQGHLGEAARRYRSVQPFPAITGRVCFHPCEEKCARNHVDEAVNINAVEQIMGDWDLKAPLEKPARRHITKVAVIGSGPGGAFLRVVPRTDGVPGDGFRGDAASRRHVAVRHPRVSASRRDRCGPHRPA